MFAIRRHVERHFDRVAVVYRNGGTIETDEDYGVEADNPLIAHPDMFDVGAGGVPSDDLGEEFRAAPIPALGTDPTQEFSSLRSSAAVTI